MDNASLNVSHRPRSRRLPRLLLAAAIAAAIPLPTSAAQPAPSTQPAAGGAGGAGGANVIPAELAGRNVEEVRLIGKTKPLTSDATSIINHQVRSREGSPFDPNTVEGDYQRIYGLKRFSNVEARVEPTRTGVIVVFEVTEQPAIKEIRFKGNDEIETATIQQVVNIRTGEAVDNFRIGLARETIERLYKSKNHPHAAVDVDQDMLRQGVVVFNIVEGPKVRVRKVKVLGNKTFADSRIRDQVKTRSWFPLFVSGTFDPDQLESDVASIREFYQNKGFFDVRVGRKVVVSPNQKEVMVTFVVDEGTRYVVERVTFKGNDAVADAELRKDLKMIEGRFYDEDLVKRDTRLVVKAYSDKGGFIYLQNEPNPDPKYMRIKTERVFRTEPGRVELVYDISEGDRFQLGRVLIKGNGKTQDKVVARELRVEPGQLYNSSELIRAQDRIRATGLFSAVTITPIQPVGAPPDSELQVRDLLVEVTEAQTARFLVGAGISSNSGLLGNITYEQKNFDISNLPSSKSELFSNRSFSGAGQTFRISLEPGTEITRARVDFVEPYIFDQPFSFGVSAYLSQRRRRDWAENRLGGRLFLGHRFNDEWSGRIFFRGEDVEIGDIRDEEERAREVLELEGHHTLATAGIELRRDTTNSPILPSEGTITTFSWEHAGLFGDFDFDKFTLGYNIYTTLYEDLLDRKTILAFKSDVGYISGDAPFFERFYGGGIGSVRGFRFRGISPRDGIEEDAIGGEFMATATVELGFPIASDVLRGVLFTDVGTVERDVEIGTLRASVGFGFRLTLPFFGQLPIALDFGFPVSSDDQDDTRIFSFSLGTTQ